MKQALKNPNELTVGTRVKLPIAGWWLGSRKKVEWFKGTIIKVGEVKEDGKIHVVVTSLRTHKRFGNLGKMMSINNQCDAIYKVKKNIKRN